MSDLDPRALIHILTTIMSNVESDSTGNPLTVVNVVSDLLLVIFIHGFKGDNDTFGKFPDRLQHVLTETVPNSTAECIVFPVYETKGDLNEAVVRFSDWLTELTVMKEVAHGGGAGKAKLVLCGHSMGGLLAADSIIEFYRTRPDTSAPLWPKIVACISFDTPYYGLHPYVFKNTATKAAEYANVAKSVGSAIWSSFTSRNMGNGTGTAPVAAITAPPTSENAWSKWAPVALTVGGVVTAAAAAGGAAYWRRDDLGVGYSWATDHMKYVRNLWDEDALKRRVNLLIEIEKMEGVIFRTFYTLLPAIPLVHNLDRTFMILPNTDRRAMDHFLPAINNTATDELQAHTGMFAAHSNDGYYKLGLEAAGLIREAVMLSRGVLQPETQIDPQLEKEEKKAAEMEKEQVVEENKTEERESTAAQNTQSASAT
ncbi:uncharacterized protein C8R40DRAFT_757624 [Lentinula edodes]|uniref:uncharacterized protein n=1 Tax=Lentinula edodes TaxID=5353 RepID=UPI001E8D7923|nr:uncharacterized protein C8R40DRAFT_757624 [Lentinula edodes]KAH7869143.1 hypothetical protein C8R40DRAFT_757624 [Lentinula edodes]